MDWTNEMELRQTGCIYQYRGVMCHNKTKCSTCGWNPKVEKERKANMAWGVTDYPQMTAKQEAEWYGDDEDEAYTDEWEEFYEDEDDDLF